MLVVASARRVNATELTERFFSRRSRIIRLPAGFPVSGLIEVPRGTLCHVCTLLPVKHGYLKNVISRGSLHDGHIVNIREQEQQKEKNQVPGSSWYVPGTCCNPRTMVGGGGRGCNNNWSNRGLDAEIVAVQVVITFHFLRKTDIASNFTCYSATIFVAGATTMRALSSRNGDASHPCTMHAWMNGTPMRTNPLSVALARTKFLFSQAITASISFVR